MERDSFPTFRRIGRGLIDGWPRRLRRLGIGLLVVFVVLAIPWTYFNITLGMNVERELEQIRERGEPLTLEEALPEMPPRNENAAYVYEQAFRVFQKWQTTPEGAVAGTPLRELDEEMQGAIADFADGKSADLPADVREWLFSAEVDQRLDAIKRASRIERCVFPVNWEDGFGALLPHLAQFRAAQRLVTARMMIAAREGRTEEALDWCEVGLRMTEHVGQEPTLIAFLVRVAMIEILSRGAQDICDDIAVPPAQAQSIGSIVDADDLREQLRRAMKAERALGGALFEPMTAGMMANLMADDGPPLWYWKFYQSLLGQPVRKYDQLRLLKGWEHLLDRIQRPFREVGFEDWPETSYDELGLAGEYLEPVTRAMLPLFGRIEVKRGHGVARLQQLQTALMLNVYRQQHGGYPRTLDELAEAMDWQPPEDIFSGEAFHYQRDGGGYLLWSVGSDLDDDGGEGPDAEGREWDDSDIVWRVRG